MTVLITDKKEIDKIISEKIRGKKLYSQSIINLEF